jgi:hypothetical protein
VHPKKFLPGKPIVLGLGKFSVGKTVVGFGCNFYLNYRVCILGTFFKSVRKDGFFDAQFHLFNEKKLSSLRRAKKPF